MKIKPLDRGQPLPPGRSSTPSTSPFATPSAIPHIGTATSPKQLANIPTQLRTGPLPQVIRNQPWPRAIALSLILGLLTGCGNSSLTGVQVVVNRVPSGNTLEVRGTGADAKRLETVRLLGIDAPDLRQQPWGIKAQQTLMELVAGQTVWLEFESGEARDRLGRLLAYVWRDGQLVNEQLTKAGYAVPASRSGLLKYDRRIFYAQEYARILELGVWDPRSPMRLRPSEFRRQNPS